MDKEAVKKSVAVCGDSLYRIESEKDLISEEAQKALGY
jgi:hypothetical protein